MAELIGLDHVTKSYRQRRRNVTAVNDVSLSICAGEILCLVGESGSGKSTIGRVLTGLTEPTTGRVRYAGRSADTMTRAERRAQRLGVQMVQQDPYASLHPGMTIGQTLGAPIARHFDFSRIDMRDKLCELLTSVGLTPADSFLEKFPHELSGGQRQRIAIARSLTVEPRVLVADEAVSMLDVSIRGSILQMLRRLCEDRQLGVVFVTHDLAVARQFGRGHSIAVMHQGRIVEHRPTQDVVTRPEHPYTRALMEAARHEAVRSRRRDRARADEPSEVRSASA